ncbi:MAG: hypothetical protein EXR87_01390 [Gammaproteobacteria bacterium]|nr:hypothetical protein [Gammaproteobacteria bacterium]
MNRRAFLAVGLLALPAAAAEPSPPPPDPEFLEFLAQTVGEDEEFVDFVESGKFERVLHEVEEQRAVSKGEDHEP